LHDKPGDEEGGEWNGDEPGDAKDLKGSSRPGEFGNRIGEIGEDEDGKEFRILSSTESLSLLPSSFRLNLSTLFTRRK